MNDPLEQQQPVGVPDLPVPSLLRVRAVAISEIVVCSSVPTQVIIATLLALVGIRPENESGLSLTFVVALSLADTIVLILLMIFLTRAHGERPRDLWLGGRPVRREALFGLLLVPFVLVLVAALLIGLRLSAPWLHNVAANPLEQLATGGVGDAVLLGAVAIIAGGVREELQRAFLLQRFERHLGGRAVGVIVLSAAFGLGHILQGWDAVVTTSVLGAFWAVVYLRRRSVAAPVVSHAGFNALEVVRVALGGPALG
jgi:membrane protease YdiL (CAAX protease family)